MAYNMKPHSHYNNLLKKLFDDCKDQYGNVYYYTDNTYNPQDFIEDYVLKNNYRANQLINELSSNSRENKENLREGLIDILTGELNEYKKSLDNYKKSLDNRMDISGGIGGSGRYKKSKSKSKKNI
jgi:hypothetical protein